MIDMKKAVVVAMDFVRTLYLGNVPSDLLLEEIELSQDNKFWLVTIGFSTPRPAGMIPTILTGSGSADRSFKLIKIDTETGQAVSMKIRKP